MPLPNQQLYLRSQVFGTDSLTYTVSVAGIEGSATSDDRSLPLLLKKFEKDREEVIKIHKGFTGYRDFKYRIPLSFFE